MVGARPVALRIAAVSGRRGVGLLQNSGRNPPFYLDALRVEGQVRPRGGFSRVRAPLDTFAVELERLRDAVYLGGLVWGTRALGPLRRNPKKSLTRWIVKINRYLLGSALVAALGGLLFGFDTIVISGTTETLTKVFGLSDFWLGFTVASALIGTIVGSVAAGRPSDAFGRRAALGAIALLYVGSAIGCALAWNWYALLFFRFVGGLGIGGASVVSPMYIAEISPARLRGRLVAVQQFNIVLGCLLAFLSNYIISQANLPGADWRWMLGVVVFPATLFFFLLFLVPNSPRWLVAKGRVEEARWVFSRLGTDDGSVDEEIAAIQDSLALDHHRVEEPFFRRQYRKPILLAVAIAMFNQLSGVNALWYYAPAIFRMAGAGPRAAMLQPVILGVVNLVVTMVALMLIDRIGRRKLMLAGSIGYIVSLGAAAWAFYTYGAAFTAAVKALDAKVEIPASVAAAVGTGGMVVMASLIVFVIAHAFGQGTVIWVFISEIFPNRVRARGQALGSFTHWILAAAISWTFPIIAARSGGHAFAFYCVMMVLQLLWVVWLMPETQGVPLEEIQKKLGIE
jgi:sugar porter (SP) family MFS transporter